jgi:DNA-binding beta-propeller fold protein YncE
MSSPITCPACSAFIEMLHDMRGQRLFCPKCGAALVITSAGVAKRDERDSAAPPSRGMPWIGHALLLLILVGIGLFYLWHRSQSQPSSPVAVMPDDDLSKLRPLTALPSTTGGKPAEPETPKPTAKTPPTTIPAPAPKSAGLPSVYSIAFSPDGKMLASGHYGDTTKLWDLATGREQANLMAMGFATVCVGFSPDGKMLASAHREGKPDVIQLFDVATRKELASFKNGGGAFCLLFTPDSKTLVASVDPHTGRWQSVLWDVTTRQPPETFKDRPNSDVSGNCTMGISPDGKTLAVLSSSTQVEVWDLVTRKQLATLEDSALGGYCIALSPDGKTLAWASNTGTIGLWDVATRKKVAGLTFSPVNASMFCMAFSPDGRTLASGNNDGTIKLWEVATRKELATFRGQGSSLSSLAFSPDGKTLASVGGILSNSNGGKIIDAWTGGIIEFWDVASRKLVRSFP